VARVDFYVLERVDEQARLILACRLTEKAYRLKNTVYLHAKSRADAERLDELLWTFRDGSFVPHALADDSDDAAASPVTIGCEAGPAKPRDLLINLCDAIPDFAADFPRVAEVVNKEPDCRRMSRERFVEYRNNGHTIQTHKI
jgi:DNA polymerase-3 subunit chi